MLTGGKQILYCIEFMFFLKDPLPKAVMFSDFPSNL